MRRASLFLLMALAACGRAPDTRSSAESLKTFDVQEAPVRSEPPERTAGPQIAYTYSFGYVIAASQVDDVQRAHLALCDQLGPARCRIVSMTRDSGSGQFAQGGLSLLVDARIARAFAERLDAAVTGAGGEVGRRGIEAEDLSKQIVDTEAKLRGKQALAERLLALLQNRQGKVGELVEAERAYAQVQEELDAARSWLAEMRQRVATSRIEIGYTSERPEGGGVWQPVRASLREAGVILGTSLAALITFGVALLPWALVGWALIWTMRRLGWLRRLRWPWRRAPHPTPGPVPPA